ncbi:MAG TPA: RNA polymerase sigma factor [Polyangiaceae bacterium]|nr:RNA polymerase sigma factor [Polyangiaceae bacterium]
MGTEPSTTRAQAAPDDPVRRAVEGDVVAIREVLEAVAPRVHAVARRVLGSGDADVEDVTQEALIALVRALPSFRGEGTVGAFAARIAVRTAVASRSRKRRRMERREALQHEPRPESPSLSPTSRRLRLLRDLLEELPAGQGETLALRVVLGCSLAEIAESTEVPLNTVRSRLRLAKEAMRRRIEADPALARALEIATSENTP